MDRPFTLVYVVILFFYQRKRSVIMNLIEFTDLYLHAPEDVKKSVAEILIASQSQPESQEKNCDTECRDQ